MRLIDADVLKKSKVYSRPRREFVVSVAQIDWAPAVDPIHDAGGCYCQECRYSTPLKDD